MSVRSGVFIKYVVKFVDPGLTVSNDVMAGDVCVDADVTVTMSRSTAGTTFTITLYDLPEPKVKLLKDRVKPGATPHVIINLGYFDTNVGLVVDGICEKINSTSRGDQLVTTVEGKEAALFACATTPYSASPLGDVSYSDAVNSVLSNAKLPPNCVSTAPQVNDLPSDLLHNPTFTTKKVLLVLDEIANRVWPQAEFLVADGKVFLGSPIRYDAVVPAQLNNGVNLAKFDPLELNIPGAKKFSLPAPGADKQVRGFQFTVVGDPAMRPAQTVIVNNIKDFPSGANPEFRIREIEHRYSASAGYVCVGAAVERQPDGALGREIDAAISRSATSAARDITDRIRSQAFDNPAVEVASVKAAADKYQADLYYGQPAPPSESQPSIAVAIDQQDDHVYAAKPIASPFAWRKCGLVTPVYQGMKALVLHNRALAGDGIVTGYLWSKEPDFPPPSNQAGDWWLCLPIDFDAAQPPGDSTKAANDLTANNGCRVITLKGLKITVGADGLQEIGTRPTLGDAEVCTIAHASGAVVTVKNGEIDVDTGAGPKLSLSSSGVTLTDGTLNVQLANGKLAIG